MKRIILKVLVFTMTVYVTPVSASILAGNAIYLDGIDDFIQIPDAPHLDGMASLTIEAWYCPLSQEAARLVWKSDGGDIYTDRSYELQLPNSLNQAYISFFSDTSGWTRLQKNDMQLTTDQWIHVSTVYDSINGFAKLYLDGQLVVSTNTQAGGVLPISESIRVTSQDLLLGAAFGTYLQGSYTHGLLDEVRIWNTARSDSQISDYFNKTVNSTDNGLIGYWNFDEDIYSQTIIDSSLSGHNGTLGSSNSIELSDPTHIISTAPIVPEPCSLFLMGIGGLLLRKRNK